MVLASLALRHLRRHWRLNLGALFGLTLAAALLAALPGYATAVAARSLYRNLEDAAPAVRNLYVTGDADALNAGVYGRLQEGLGELLISRVQVRQAGLRADPPPVQVDPAVKTAQWLGVWSFDGLSGMVHVIAGRLPGPAEAREEPNPFDLPPIEVVVGSGTAALLGLKPGDSVTASQEVYQFDVVGIVEPLDPVDDGWGGDLSAFTPEVDTSNADFDSITAGVIAAPGSMINLVPMHLVYWRVLINRDLISVDSVEAVRERLVNLQSKLGTNRVQISTGLIQILDDYRTQLARVRSALFLLTLQAFIFVLYTLSMLTSFLLDRSQVELATLSSRGATGLQLTLVFALQGLVLALPAALLLGPAAAYAGLKLWSMLAAAAVPAALPRESWLLAAGAAAFGWLALVLPVYPGTRRNLLDWQRARARPAQLSPLQKTYLDLFLLVLGGLLFWQLNQSGSFLMRRLGATALADPLLLLGPSLMLVAVAMLFLRLFPFLLRLVAWLFRRTRGLLLPLGLSRLARDPLKPSRVVLLISLTAGLALFTQAFSDSLARSQQETARYRAGADLRVALDARQGFTAGQVAALPGVQASSRVLRSVIQTPEGRAIQLLAVDPATFARVARYPPGLTGLTIGSITRAIDGPVNDAALPAVFSYDATPANKRVGDLLLLALRGRRISFQIQGTIQNFPTLSGAFVIVGLPQLEEIAGVEELAGLARGGYEAWLAVDPAQHGVSGAERHANLVNHPQLQGRILDDVQLRLRELRGDALAEGTSSAFALSTLTLAVLSVAGFLLVHYFAAQQRGVEFGVLRAMGLSARQLFTLLATEGALVALLGLGVGSLIGYGLTRAMVPYLSRALSASLSGVSIGEILFHWPAILRLYGLIAGFYALATVLLLFALMRVGVHRVMRIGDE